MLPQILIQLGDQASLFGHAVSRHEMDVGHRGKRLKQFEGLANSRPRPDEERLARIQTNALRAQRSSGCSDVALRGGRRAREAQHSAPELLAVVEHRAVQPRDLVAPHLQDDVDLRAHAPRARSRRLQQTIDQPPLPGGPRALGRRSRNEGRFWRRPSSRTASRHHC
ncbi:MAG TPA: hypothetical protein DD714_06605, partial [Candidatus Omnitrophica bacterium]|nr:hypothetical protein [Candidatus Omnitrophota bacterium]